MTGTPKKTRPKPARYAWNHPREWLDYYLEGDYDRQDLANIVRQLADELDADALQDLFQADMDEYGYFVDLNTLDTATCPACATLLSDIATVEIAGTSYPTYCETCDREIAIEELGVNTQKGQVS